MYVRNYPQTFVKDGERRTVYYTCEARELIDFGWQREDSEPPLDPEPKSALEFEPESELEAPTAPEPEPELEVPAEPKIDFESFTKTQLLQYALTKGVTLPAGLVKSELIEECRKLTNE